MILSAPSGRILSEQNGFTQMPIASLTKLMSAMIVLDHGVDLGKELTIAPGEFTIGGNLRIVPGSETVTVRDLLYASITGSANNAALALARSTGLSRQDFLREMNRKAVALGLEQTSFADPTGLSPANVGSAYDVAQLAAVAFRDYPLIRDAASRGEHTVVTRNTQRVHVLKNPNGLFRRSPGRFIASKTGYLDEALYCLVLARETPHGTIIAVTLGHPSEEGSEEETLNLLDEAERRVAGLVTPEKDSVH
jgi:D-alanyl-D-alanine endopeptidase (penicillin-binding protein 7)